MTNPVSFLFVAQTTTLILTSILLVYPVVAYSRNVAYTWGLVLLAGSFFALTATYVTTFVYASTLVSSALDLLAAILASLGTWQFARPFVDTDGSDGVETITTDQASGGFESARDD